MKDAIKSGNSIWHSKYGMGVIRTVFDGEMEVDFQDGQRRYLKVDLDKMRVPTSNDKFIFMADGVPDILDDIDSQKHYVKDRLRSKTNTELQTLCVQFGIDYTKYDKTINLGLYRMHMINALIKPILENPKK